MLFKTVKTQKVNENIYVVRTGISNFYIFKDKDTMICFDTGFIPPIIKIGLKKLGINPDDIQRIFLTHSDYDHVGGVKLFQNSKVYISESEEQMINGSTARALWVKYNSRIKREYTTLQDNQEIIINGIKIRGISSPGHTPGSMSYLVNDEILFVGDTMRLYKKQIKPFFALQNMDTKTQKGSIQKLMRIEGIKMICTAHFGYMYL